MTYLALGNVIFLLLFLLASPSARLLGGASYADDDNVMVPPLDGPVILVVLDEFPLTSLIDSQGQIIEERYPNFADLARRSNWFRNAAAETTATFVSVPSILSGVRGDSDNLPSYLDYPDNYFTMFGSKYPINRYEPVTDLCPPDHCKPPPSSPLSQAIGDGLVVYGHRVLPESLRGGLPDIDRSWGNFGDDLDDEAASPPDDPFVNAEGEIADEPMTKLADLAESDQGRVGQSRAFQRQIQQIGSEPSVDFMHFLLPHHPYLLTPWGTINADHWIPSDTPAHPGKPGYDWAYRELYALQALQLGAVDAMIGDLMDRLEATGTWEDATLVVTSDHGIDISPPGVGRTPNDDNMDELFRVPMFIKAPGQTVGEIRDEPASTVDVLPSIADLLGVETSWSFEGHSLFDGSEPESERLLDTDLEAAFETAESHTSQFLGHSWEDLAAVGAGADLVGQPVSAFEMGDPSELQVAFDHAELLDNLSASSGEVPYWLQGAASGRDDAPPELAIAVNGTFAGTIGGYRADGDVWRFSGFMANYFTDGANDVVAYEVEEGADGVVLHPAATD